MKLADFYQIVAPELPGCPDETLRRAIVSSVQTLCRKAHIWREVQDPVPLVDGAREYEADAPIGARVINIDEVFVGADNLVPLTLNELHWRLPDWQTAQGSTPAYYVGANDWGAINLYPLPREPRESLVMRVEFEPLGTATSLPDFLMQRYQEEICRGVKSRCMAMPKMAWSDPVAAEYWRQLFESDVGDATIKMLHDRNSGSIRVQPRRFG